MVMLLTKAEHMVANMVLAMVYLTISVSGIFMYWRAMGITTIIRKPVPMPVSPAMNPPMSPASDKRK